MKYFKHENGLYYLKIIESTENYSEYIFINLYNFSTSIEYREYMSDGISSIYTDGCSSCSEKEFNNAFDQATSFLNSKIK
jgi:hypothetical protein